MGTKANGRTRPRQREQSAEDAAHARWKRIAERAGVMFQNQRRRAREAGHWIDYTCEELRAIVKLAVDKGDCPYCGGKLTEDNFSCDHRVPVARTGGHVLGNLIVCCASCNQAKGPLDHVEWRQLLNLLAGWAPTVRAHTLARLRAGAARVKAGAGFHPPPPNGRPAGPGTCPNRPDRRPQEDGE